MIELRDSTFIEVPPEQVWAWLEEMPPHYRQWHPDHVACRYEDGRVLRTGTVLYVEERLHGGCTGSVCAPPRSCPGKWCGTRAGASPVRSSLCRRAMERDSRLSSPSAYARRSSDESWTPWPALRCGLVLKRSGRTCARRARI